MSQRPQHPSPIPQGGNLAHMTPGGAFPGTPGGSAPMLGGLQAEVSPEAAPLWEFALTHARAIAFGVVALVLIIVGIAGWQWYRESAHDSARRELSLIISGRDTAKKLADLQAFLPKASSALKPAVLLESAAAAIALNQLEDAQQLLAQVEELEKSSPMGTAAALNRADVLMRLGKGKEAVTVLDALLISAPENVRGMINQQIADFAAASGMKERAATAYDALIAALPPTETQSRDFYTRQKKQLQ